MCTVVECYALSAGNYVSFCCLQCKQSSFLKSLPFLGYQYRLHITKQCSCGVHVCIVHKESNQVHVKVLSQMYTDANGVLGL